MNLFKRILIIPAILSLLLVAGCGPGGGSGTPDISKDHSPRDIAEPNTPAANEDSGKKNAQKQLLNRIMELAASGKTVDCEFPVETTVIEDIEKQWGKPDQLDYVAEAKGSYATYVERGFSFGFNKGSQIFDVRSYDKAIKQIPLSIVKEVLGEPDHINRFNGEDILGYKVSDKYKLRIVLPQSSSENPDPLVDHISVYYSQGTVNSMADDPGLEW